MTRLSSGLRGHDVSRSRPKGRECALASLARAALRASDANDMRRARRLLEGMLRVLERGEDRQVPKSDLPRATEDGAQTAIYRGVVTPTPREGDTEGSLVQVVRPASAPRGGR